MVLMKEFNGKRIAISTNGTWIFGHPYFKNVSRQTIYIFYKLQLKMYQQPKYTVKIIKFLEDMLGQTQSGLCSQMMWSSV